METASCVFVVILIQLVDGSSIRCLGGNCTPQETVTRVIKANKTNGTTPSTASATQEETTVQSIIVPSTSTLSTEWPPRRVICPPFDPYENLFELFRTSFLKTTNVPTLRAKSTKLTSPEILKRLLKTPKSQKLWRVPTNTPSQDATVFEKTKFLSTTSRRQTTIAVSSTQASSTTEIPHLFAWRLK